MALFNYRENETMVIEKKGDYWKGVGGTHQIRGNFEVTNQRVAFKARGLGAPKENLIELELSEIASMKKCNVGDGFLKIVPTGIKITTVNGEKYIFSVMKRDAFMQALQGMANV